MSNDGKVLALRSLCSSSADAHYSVSISSSDREAIPINQVTTAQANPGWKCFYGYALYEEITSNFGKRYIVKESQEWQAQSWVVSVDAIFDSGYPHYTAKEISEAVYTFGVDQGLFPAGTCP